MQANWRKWNQTQQRRTEEIKKVICIEEQAFSLGTGSVCVGRQHAILEVKKEIHRTKLNVLYQHYFIIATVINKMSKWLRI